MALSEHLIVKTRPVANEKNMVFWKDYRVTVLGDRLFRIEKNQAKKFRDSATQSVWYRDFPKQEFLVNDREEFIEISTKCVKLILKENREECTVVINDNVCKINNDGNLLGTYRTLDGCMGSYNIYDKKEITLGMGVCSKTGVAVINDEESLSLGEDGMVKPEKGEGTDEYVFCFGNDYRGAVKALYSITGEVPMVPRFALGNWWSRYHIYTDEEYLRILNRFEEREIPLTVATIDMDWHYSDFVDEEVGVTEKGRDTEFYGWNKDKTGRKNGWTGYTWNKNLFPDYKAFLKEILKRNLKITLNLHPADGIRWWEDQYEDMARAMGIDPETCQQVKFDIASDKFINNYFEILHRPFEKDGVRFWWMDWQQGTKSTMEGLDPLWSLNHYHYLDNKVLNKAPLLLSRYAGVGSHRYPLGFSGDTTLDWKTLQYLPYFTLTASNVGYTWWSHDIGGHWKGVFDEQLYLRSVQFGVFNPINRLHSTATETITKEPWYYGNGTGKLAEEQLKLRHRLIPMLYTADYHTHKDGIALVEPLYYTWDVPKAYEIKNEYVFAENYLVVVVNKPLEKDGFARTEAYIPQGVWTDIFTGDVYNATTPVTKTLLRQLESIPVLAKAGTILPMSFDKGNSADNPKNLVVYAYNGDGEYTLYEDGAERNEEGEFFTHFKSSLVKGENTSTQTIRISSEGDENVIPKDRTLRLEFRNLLEDKPATVGTYNVTVFKDGKELETEKMLEDYVTVKFDFEAKANYEIVVEFKTLSEVEKFVLRAKDVLSRVSGGTWDKNDVYLELLKSCNSVKKYVSIVNKGKISKVLKERLLETII